MYIHVSVLTKQKKEVFIELKPLYFEISVKEEAKNNQANRRILSMLSQYFQTKKIRIINGHTSPRKLISVEDSNLI